MKTIEIRCRFTNELLGSFEIPANDPRETAEDCGIFDSRSQSAEDTYGKLGEIRNVFEQSIICPQNPTERNSEFAAEMAACNWDGVEFLKRLMIQDPHSFIYNPTEIAWFSTKAAELTTTYKLNTLTDEEKFVVLQLLKTENPSAVSIEDFSQGTIDEKANTAKG